MQRTRSSTRLHPQISVVVDVKVSMVKPKYRPQSNFGRPDESVSAVRSFGPDATFAPQPTTEPISRRLQPPETSDNSPLRRLSDYRLVDFTAVAISLDSSRGALTLARESFSTATTKAPASRFVIVNHRETQAITLFHIFSNSFVTGAWDLELQSIIYNERHGAWTT